MSMKRVRARVATTHAIPAYGGIRLADEAAHQMADALATGQVPMNFGHDMARPVRPANVEAGTERLEDGELAVWVEFDVDAETWDAWERQREAVGAPGGFSFTTNETFAARGGPPYDFQITADAAHFDDDFILRAAAETLPPENSVELGHLFQFSWVPDPKVVIGVATTILSGVPGNLLASYLYDLAKRFRDRMEGRKRGPIFEIRVERTPTSQNTIVKIDTAHTADLEAALMQVPDILRAEATSAFWNDLHNRYDDADRVTRSFNPTSF